MNIRILSLYRRYSTTLLYVMTLAMHYYDLDLSKEARSVKTQRNHVLNLPYFS